MWNILKNNLKIIKTCDIYLCIFSVGLSISLTGPCLLDLQRMIGTDTQHIAFIYTSRSIGFLVGAIIGGILLDNVRSKFSVLTVCNLIITVTVFGIPWSRSVSVLVSLCIFNGLALGALETGANVVCIELWGSGPYFQALHFTFGFGALVSPLIAAPFLENQNVFQPLYNSSSSSDTKNIYPNFSDTESFYSNYSTDTSMEGIPNVIYPFSIVGTFSLLVSTLFFVTFLASPIDSRASLADKENKTGSGWLYIFSTVTFTFLIFFVVAGSEIGFAQTLTTYAVKGGLQATPSLGSYMTSAFWAAFTIMRLISIFLSVKVSNMTLIIGDIISIAVSGILLLFCMPNEWALWAVCVIFGGGTASGFPSLVGWLSDYIEITNKISATFTVGVAAGEMVYPFIIAYFMEIVPDMFVYVTASTSVLILILLLILYGIVKEGKRSIESKETACQAQNNEICQA